MPVSTTMSQAHFYTQQNLTRNEQVDEDSSNIKIKNFHVNSNGK